MVSSAPAVMSRGPERALSDAPIIRSRAPAVEPAFTPDACHAYPGAVTQSLQDRYAPHNACFGCGPANASGLRLKSVVQGDEVVCTWQAKTMHEAFPGVLNGGIIGTLL